MDRLFADIREGFAIRANPGVAVGDLPRGNARYLIFLGTSEVLLPFVVRKRWHGSAVDLGAHLRVGGIGAMTWPRS